METKKQLLFIACLFSFILCLTVVSATITINSPTEGTTLKGNYLFWVETTLSEPTNCSWSTTANANFNSTVNETAQYTDFFMSFLTTGLTDAKDTTLSVNCTNNSVDSDYGSLTINVDNTNPVCSFSMPIASSTVEYLSAEGVSPTDASTDTTDLTYAWILYDPSFNSQDTSTSSSPTFSSDDFDEIGEFTLSLIVTDEASKNNSCTNQTIIVTGTNGDAETSTGTITIIQQYKTPFIIFLVIIFLVIIAIAGFYVVNKIKK